MVRPGLKRLQEAQRVKVQPNKTGTSAMLGRAGLFNRSAKNVVFSSIASTPYNNLAFSKDFEPEYTANDRKNDNMCECVKKTEYARDANSNIISSYK